MFTTAQFGAVRCMFRSLWQNKSEQTVQFSVTFKLENRVHCLH